MTNIAMQIVERAQRYEGAAPAMLLVIAISVDRDAKVEVLTDPYAVVIWCRDGSAIITQGEEWSAIALLED